MAMQFLTRRSLSGSMTVYEAPRPIFTEAEADRLAQAGAAFEVINGRAVQTHLLAGDGYIPIDGKDQA